MVDKQRISCGQLICLLTLSRIFYIFTYIPSVNQMLNGSIMLLCLPLSTALSFIIIMPSYYFLKKSKGHCLVDGCNAISPASGKTAAAVLAVYFLFIAAQTVSQFEYFMTSAVYHGKGTMTFFIILSLVAAYFVYMSIEPISRAAGIIMFVVVISLGVMFFTLLGHVNLVNVISPFYEGVKEVVKVSVFAAFRNTELVALLMMLPYTNGNFKKIFVGYQLWALLLLELITFFTLTVLGNFARTTNYPVYSLSTITGFSFLQGLDAIYNCIWVFIALIRTAFYLFLTVRCIGLFCDNRFKKSYLPISTFVLLIIGCILSNNTELFVASYKLISNGFIIASVVFIIPIVLLGVLLIRPWREQR
ncbi:MAG: GerAB/ArcD/ProY family transporter [Oscillospiraceae bacterium]